MSIYICLVSVFSEENKNGVSSTLGMSWRHKWRDIFFLNPEQSRAFFFKDCNTPLMLLMKQQTRILRSLPLPGPYSVIGARKHLFSDTKQSIWKMYWNPHRLQWWNLLSGTKSAPFKKKLKFLQATSLILRSDSSIFFSWSATGLLMRTLILFLKKNKIKKTFIWVGLH